LLFLVISTPRPERPSTVSASRKKFWPWMGRYLKAKKCRLVHARAGRGAIALLDVKSNEELHAILNEWADIIPTHFDVYPLIDTQAALKYLDKGKRGR
jgi:hypothetical protein